MQSYSAARSLFSFIAFVAWSAIIVGGIVTFLAAVAISQFNGSLPAVISAALPGLVICLFGFLALVMVQIGRAAVDSAEYGQQALQVARDQLAFAKQVHLERDTHRPETAASFATAETKPAAAPPAERQNVTHNGTAITANPDGTYLVSNQVFDTLDAAKTYLDTRPAWCADAVSHTPSGSVSSWCIHQKT